MCMTGLLVQFFHLYGTAGLKRGDADNLSSLPLEGHTTAFMSRKSTMPDAKSLQRFVTSSQETLLTKSNRWQSQRKLKGTTYKPQSLTPFCWLPLSAVMEPNTWRRSQVQIELTSGHYACRLTQRHRTSPKDSAKQNMSEVDIKAIQCTHTVSMHTMHPFLSMVVFCSRTPLFHTRLNYSFIIYSTKWARQRLQG